MLSSLEYFATFSFDGNILHAIVRMKKALKKAEYLTEGTSLTF